MILRAASRIPSGDIRNVGEFMRSLQADLAYADLARVRPLRYMPPRRTSIPGSDENGYTYQCLSTMIARMPQVRSNVSLSSYDDTAQHTFEDYSAPRLAHDTCFGKKLFLIQ